MNNKNNIIYRTYTIHIHNNNQFYKNLIDIGKINKAIFNSIIYFFKQNYFYYQNLINNNQIKDNPIINIKYKDLINFFSNSSKWTIKEQQLYNPINILPNKDLYQSQNTQVSQQTIISAFESIKSFINLQKQFIKGKIKYRPNLPKYIRNDTYVSTFTNQLCNINYQDINNYYDIKNLKTKIKIIKYKKEKNILTYDQIKKLNLDINKFNKIIVFPKGILQDFIININHINNLYAFKELRIHFKHNIAIIDIVYEIKIKQKRKRYKYKKRYCGIDLGVNILAACSFSCNIPNLLIKSNEIKTINNKYNYLISKYKSINMQCGKYKKYIFENETDEYFKNDIENIIYDKRIKLDNNGNKYIMKDNYNITKRLHKLWLRRENKIKDLFHKVSKKIVDYCYKHYIDVIIIGQNKNWKIKRKGMKNFVRIPFYKLVQMIKYKAEEKGIRIEEVHERYTSGCSVLDRELPMKKCYNKSRRMTRGLFKSNMGKYIHADINAAYNMILKWKYIKIRNKKWKLFKAIRKLYTGMLLSNYYDMIVIDKAL